MTEKQKNYKKHLIKKVHISAKYQEYYKDHKDIYKAMLKEDYNVDSSLELSISKLESLISFLNYASFGKVLATENQVNFLKMLWSKKGREKSGLIKFIKHKFKQDASNLYDLSKSEASKIIFVLNKFEDTAEHLRGKIRVIRPQLQIIKKSDVKEIQKALMQKEATTAKFTLIRN